MVDLPARKVGATDIPLCALCVRRQDERALCVYPPVPVPHSCLTPSRVSCQSSQTAHGLLCALWSRTGRFEIDILDEKITNGKSIMGGGDSPRHIIWGKSNMMGAPWFCSTRGGVQRRDPDHGCMSCQALALMAATMVTA